MENKLKKSYEVNKVKMEDVSLFGDFLQKIRLESGLSARQVALNLKLNKSAIADWELGDAFPEESRLSDIALCYENILSDIPQEHEAKFIELVRRFKISKEAKKLINDARKNPKSPRISARSDTDVFPTQGTAFLRKSSAKNYHSFNRHKK